MTNELLPCPFCRKTPNFINHEHWNNFLPSPNDPKWDIGCGTTGCILEDGAGWYCTQDEITKMWNTRAQEENIHQ